MSPVSLPKHHVQRPELCGAGKTVVSPFFFFFFGFCGLQVPCMVWMLSCAVLVLLGAP